MDDFKIGLIKKKLSDKNIQKIYHWADPNTSGLRENEFIFSFIYKGFPFAGAILLSANSKEVFKLEDIIESIDKFITKEIIIIDKFIFSNSKEAGIESGDFFSLLIRNSYLMYNFLLHEESEAKLSTTAVIEFIDKYKIEAEANTFFSFNAFLFILDKLAYEGVVIDEDVKSYISKVQYNNPNLNTLINIEEGLFYE